MVQFAKKEVRVAIGGRGQKDQRKAIWQNAARNVRTSCNGTESLGKMAAWSMTQGGGIDMNSRATQKGEYAEKRRATGTTWEIPSKHSKSEGRQRKWRETAKVMTRERERPKSGQTKTKYLRKVGGETTHPSRENRCRDSQPNEAQCEVPGGQADKSKSEKRRGSKTGDQRQDQWGKSQVRQRLTEGDHRIR